MGYSLFAFWLPVRETSRVVLPWVPVPSRGCAVAHLTTFLPGGGLVAD